MRLIDADALKQHIDKLPALPDGNFAGNHSALKALINMQPTIEPEPHWIPCSECLPKQSQEVICQCRASIIKVLKLDANGDWYQDAAHCYMGGFVIAWMPLPDPYKGEQHEID